MRSDTTKYFDPDDAPALDRGDSVRVRYDPVSQTRVQGANWPLDDNVDAVIPATIGAGFQLFGIGQAAAAAIRQRIPRTRRN